MKPVTIRTVSQRLNAVKSSPDCRRAFASSTSGTHLTASLAVFSSRPCRPYFPSDATNSSFLLGSRARNASSSSKSSSALKKTQLYDLHIVNKAKLVPFAGYSMPLHYEDLGHLD